jgi:hypothetical protein
MEKEILFFKEKKKKDRKKETFAKIVRQKLQWTTCNFTSSR